MVISNKLLLLCLVYSGHMTLGAAVLIPSSHFAKEAISGSASGRPSNIMHHSQPSHKPSLTTYQHSALTNPANQIEIDQLYIQPFYQQYSDPAARVLEKRSPYKYTPPATERYNAVVQWDIEPAYPKKKHADHHGSHDYDDGDKDNDHEDDDDDYEEEYEYDDDAPYYEGKYDKEDGWKHGKKTNRRVIYLSTVVGPQVTTTVTVLPSVPPPCKPGVPTVPILSMPIAERLVTVLVTPAVQTIRLPAEVVTIAGKERTIQGAEHTLTQFSPTTIQGKDIYLPGVTNVITALGEVTTLTMPGTTIRGEDVFGTITQTVYGATQYGATQYGATLYGATLYGATQYGATEYAATEYAATEYGATQYGATETLEASTVTADGVITTVFQDPVTLTEQVTIQAPPLISTVRVTQFLLRQTVVATTVATATAVQTVAVTSLNNVIVTLYGNTVTSTQNVIVTIRRPKSTSTEILEPAVAFIDQDSTMTSTSNS